MADLYGGKWASKSGEIMDDNGTYMPTFKLWVRKTEGLTEKQFARGMEEIEHQCAREAKEGKESWPPGYAQFIGLATKGWETAAHKPFDRLGLPDKTKQERAKVAGAKALAEMKNLF